MRATGLAVCAVLVGAAMVTPLDAQLGLGGKSLVLKRSLPPAVALDAKSFNINASAQEPGGRDVAASFRELFKAKIQGDERFVYTDVNPALRMSIVVTRFYVEPKTLTAKKGQCVTNLGNLQGTFSVIDSESGRPYASDAIGWKLQTTETRHVLVSDDGDLVGIEGPQDKMSPTEVWTTTATDKNAVSRLVPGFGGASSPCDNPFTSNEARDALADAFLTEIVRLATPYTVDVAVPVPNERFLRNALEDIQADRWSQALDALMLTKEQPKPDDEAARLYLLGIAFEGLGYKQGVQAFEISKKIQPRLATDQLAQYQGELARVVDLAKDYFDKASLSFSNANKRNDEDEYRAGERRADQSRALYLRIQKYRDLKPAAPTDTRLRLTMAQIVDNCSRNMAAEIIVDQIANADELLATRQQVGELVNCGERQTPIFNALKKRWDAGAKPAPAAAEPAAKPAPATGTKPAPAAGAKPAPAKPPAPRK